jgi:hypothetical protein
MSELILTEKATATTPAAGKGTVYLKPGGGLYIKDSTGAEAPLGTAGGGGGGVTDHGALTGLGDDDHTQYLNNARGDARYDALGTSAAHSGSTTNPHSVNKAQVGLGNADNTSDLNKPISTATQSALDAKQVVLVSTTNIKTINGASVLGAGDLTVAGTGGVTDHGLLTGLTDDDHAQYLNNTRGDARYEATGAVAAHAGTGGAAHANVVAAGASGFMTGADKTKLDAITGTNTGDQTSVTGNAGTATALAVGADRTKLDGIEAGANNYTHPASHAPSIITQDASNRFVTDVEKAAWDAKQPAGTYATGGGSATGTNTGDNAVNTLYSGLVTNATHTGDATGSGALTVVAINGTSLAALATGLLKNTTGTGVPSIATNADLPAMSATVGGAVPTPPNNTTTFLRGDGIFAAPASGGSLTVSVVSGTTQTAVAATHYILTNVAATTVTLPASPSSGDTVWVTVTNSRTTNVIARNGKTIMGVAEDMTIDNQNATVELRFVDSSWRLV